MERPSFDTTFMHIAVLMSYRSTCHRKHVGCVIANRLNQIVSTGYNGSVPGGEHCNHDNHIMHEGHCIRTTHAEANAIAQCAMQGKSTSGCVAYVTTKPCHNCLMLLAQAGIDKVTYLVGYRPDEDKLTQRLASTAGIVMCAYEGAKPWETENNELLKYTYGTHVNRD